MKGNLCKIGLLGMGTIGTGSSMVLEKEREGIKARTGIDFEFVKILEKFVDRPRPVKLPLEKFTQNPADIFEDPEIDVVVELLGGIHPAVDFMVDAMNHGKHVVTANKALLALHGEELFRAAAENGVDICYEASVGGGIPILKALREGLRLDHAALCFSGRLSLEMFAKAAMAGIPILATRKQVGSLCVACAAEMDVAVCRTGRDPIRFSAPWRVT